MIEFGLSGRSHDFLGAPGQHHALSHFTNATEKSRLEVVESWSATQIGHLLGLLETTTMPSGQSLLDETVVLAIASMGEGSSHDHANNCPLIFGGAGLVACDGRQVSGGGTPLANLHVTLLEAFGIQGQFGTNGAIFGDHGTASVGGIVI